MRRSAEVFAVAIAACASLVIFSSQASSDPARSAGHGQLVQDPSGQLVSVVHGTHPAEQQNARKDPPPATNLSTAAGTGCA